jgi:acyl-CoA synthetase (NDP forming)
MVNGFESLNHIFNPKSVAIVGISTSRGGVSNTGQLFLDILLDHRFKGNIYPVNPRGGEISGFRVYPSLKDIPEPVDYVISCIPAAGVLQLIRDCAENGVKAICVFTAGFSETGRVEGRELEKAIGGLAKETGVRIIGPNCMGLYLPKAGVSFAAELPKENGRAGLICQSGGNTIYTVRAAAERGIRFSKVISYGNACDVNESELLEYFAQDDETSMVAAYIEGVRDGRRFSRALRDLCAVKPVVILKGGHTEAGKDAAASHTGSLAGSNETWGSLLEQVGAIHVHTLDEMVDVLVTFQFMPVPQGRRMAIYGVGGGATVLATDDCAAAGFSLPPLSEEIREELREEVRRAFGSDVGTILGNPLDFPPIASSDDVYSSVLRRILGWDGIDLLLCHMPLRGIMLTLPLACAIFDSQVRNVLKVADESSKPVAMVVHCLASAESRQAASRYVAECSNAGLPAYYSIASAARAIDRLVRYDNYRRSIDSPAYCQ